MEKCRICGNELGPNMNKLCHVSMSNDFNEYVHRDCRDLAVAKYIADQEAERKKEKSLSLEETIRGYLIKNHAVYFAPSTIDRIITMVREHDATAPKPTTPADVLQLRVEVLERSLKERTEELNISRGLAKRAIQLLGGDS